MKLKIKVNDGWHRVVRIDEENYWIDYYVSGVLRAVAKSSVEPNQKTSNVHVLTEDEKYIRNKKEFFGC